MNSSFDSFPSPSLSFRANTASTFFKYWFQLIESVLGKGKQTSGDNIAFFSPFTSHYKPKLEINLNTNHEGQNPWHCWISDKKGRTFGGKMDTEDPRYEIAIPEKDVIDIIRVLKREK